MSTFVPLNRRFLVWTAKDTGDPEVMQDFLASRESLTWDDLLARHRVVILAEAGSGKTTELSRQTELAAEAGRYAFHATVQNVGSRGLAAALGSAETQKLEEWRNSDQPAWFFFDSVDEAKARDIPLDDALAAIADGIRGGEARAHIILSGRHTDWEFRRDLKRLEESLRMPPADQRAPSVDPNELITRVVRQDGGEQEAPPPAENPLVAVMAALDHDQVRTFVSASGVRNVDKFCQALDDANLWDFARRPLDLEWLVRFWQAKGKFGSLAEMLELSLQERLKETDPQRDRRDPIDTERAIRALERVGAALVLQGLRDIAVPDSSLDLSEGQAALDLAEILPDWSGAERARLIIRAVFDPARTGCARLHSDNVGTVRSFLAARWLKRLMDGNCPATVVMDLLFDTTHGIKVVIPSMRQVVAWLSLWRPEIAKEVIDRDPYLFMDADDPASLTLDVREKALKAVVTRLLADDEFEIPNRDSFKRFALPDMSPCIRELWSAHGDSPEVRELLLQMIWRGQLTSCADLAIAASFGVHDDLYTQVFSGRALMATASAPDKTRYAEYIKDNASKIPNVLVWDAIDMLFPDLISTGGLLHILSMIDVADRSGGMGLDYHGPKFAERLTSAGRVEQFLKGLLDLVSTLPVQASDFPERNDEPHLSTIEALGRRLLELSPKTTVPDFAIDAALHLGGFQRHRYWRRSSEDAPDFYALLRETPERRRTALWMIARKLSVAGEQKGKSPIADFMQIEIGGGPLNLEPADFEWLLEDAERREKPHERQIATTAALWLWVQGGRQVDQLDRIRKIGETREEVAASIEEWTRPRPHSEEDHARKQKLDEIRQQRAMDEAERDRSWKEFANKLRANPGQLREFNPPTERSLDARIYGLYQLLSAIGQNRSRYAINDLSPLVPMFGSEVVDAFREALIAHWRIWLPKRRSEKPIGARNTSHYADHIGIVGLTLEAIGDPAWATKLNHDEAVRAAIYATLELNGFPAWFRDLALAQPDAVREVLIREIASEIEPDQDGEHYYMLEKVSYADAAIASLLAESLFEHLCQKDGHLPSVVRPLLHILQDHFRDKAALVSLLYERFDNATTVVLEAAYFVPFFKLDPAQAISSLNTKLETLERGKQTLLVQTILPGLVGGRFGETGADLTNIPLTDLVKLIIIAYRTIRLEDDKDHADGVAYTPDERDDAENARSALLRTLADTPGIAAFDAIHRLVKESGFPVRRKRMLKLAHDRAEKDSEYDAWSSAEVCGFETDFSRVPHTPYDLQRLILGRLADLQYHLQNADYNQGKIVAGLEQEVDVQNWIAEKLRSAQGRSYSLEREAHVADEKEPDIRFRAKATDANVPMEIKVAESWSLPELEDAVKKQLVRQYLRDRHNRFGILLLVHQKTRPRGWKGEEGKFITFDQVVTHLRAIAREIAAKEPMAPVAEVAVIDVSAEGSGPLTSRR